MLIVLILLFVAIIIGGLYAIFFFKRDTSNPYQLNRDPLDVLTEVMEKMKSDESKFLPLKYIRMLKYVRQETGMSLMELQKYINNLDESDASLKQFENQSKRK